MQYRKDRYGNELSALGFGCMRFQRKLGVLDIEEVCREIDLAIEKGVNYFDTAYIYPGSEAALGEALARNGKRDSVYIASKLPHYLIGSRETLDKLFYEQLRRLRTDHIDYYLMHMLTDDATWKRLVEMGVDEWIAEKKQSGEIRQVGFSYHGGSEMFCRLVDAYDWDFCQIQYNYMDENSQAGRTGLCHANEKGLPVVIMEPLRGGSLAGKLPKRAKAVFQQAGADPVRTALRWLWDQPQVTVVLSGMNTEQMILENTATASEAVAGCLTDEERDILKKASDAINKDIKIPCTGCGYCRPCPKGVDIPGVFAAYNRLYSEGRFSALREYFMCTTFRQNSTAASNCVKCGRCEQHCPQHIDIRNRLEEVTRELEGPLFRIGSKAAKLFLKL